MSNKNHSSLLTAAQGCEFTLHCDQRLHNNWSYSGHINVLYSYHEINQKKKWRKDMKLAWKELMYNKKRYILIEGILVLMIFMVLFLSGLANGLGRAVSAGVDNINADYFILSSESDGLIGMSGVQEEELQTIKDNIDSASAPLNVQRMSIRKSGTEEKADITYFAIDENSFLAPEIIEGSSIGDTKEEENTIVLNNTYKEEGINIGDIIEDSTTGIAMKVTGFTKDSFYGHTPAGFITMNTFAEIRTEINPGYKLQYNTVAVNKTQNLQELGLDNLEILEKQEVISNIPGYSAEQTTINMILWVLVVISAAVLGVFFYVITIQKQKEFGVMKAIGMEMKEITAMIISQVAILACSGLLIGNLLAFGMAKFLPASMPFYMEAASAIVVSAVFMMISVICSLFSAVKVAKVDPVITIGGNE